MAQVVLIFLLCLVYAGQAAPHVNETHYLTKAKHFWNPEWCKADLFLTSSNPHLLFYVTFGWLTTFFPLTTVAWIGRIATWILFAFSWHRVSLAATQRSRISIFTALIFLLLLDKCHLAGEWIVGGVEAKGFAFPFVFWGLASMLNSRWKTCWVLMGIASAFHVLVGGWACLASVIVFGLTRDPKDPAASLKSQLLPLTLGGLISLIGVLPPIFVGLSAEPGTTHQANVILVTQRLGHHQLFGEFSTSRIAAFSGLILVWFVVAKLAPRSSQLKKLNTFAFISLVIGFIGLMLSSQVELDSNSFGVDLLIYYWFRLSDFAIPMALTFLLVGTALRFRQSGSTSIQVLQTAGPVSVGILFAMTCFDRWSDPRPFSVRRSLYSYEGQPTRTLETFKNWNRVCEWVRDNTAEDALFLTPAKQQTFKWYAHRAEVVNWKDVPQDATGIIQWYDRIQRFNRVQLMYPGGIWAYTDEQLLSIAQETGATHIVSLQSDLDSRPGSPPQLKQLYPADPAERATFVVFELRRE